MSVWMRASGEPLVPRRIGDLMTISQIFRPCGCSENSMPIGPAILAAGPAGQPSMRRAMWSHHVGFVQSKRRHTRSDRPITPLRQLLGSASRPAAMKPASPWSHREREILAEQLSSQLDAHAAFRRGRARDRGARASRDPGRDDRRRDDGGQAGLCRSGRRRRNRGPWPDRRSDRRPADRKGDRSRASSPR